MTNEMQGVRIILDPFLEHPEFGVLLAECQCPQSNFRTGHSLENPDANDSHALFLAGPIIFAT